ncbi:hypothetical protein SEUCBS140593_006837 [Sporothrix eucalyptigena]|uniref:Uncharacterized protein n=1 Tax=Sporothrix eucalyptigena TaxID=1812306 RepID=A0ABP0C8I5_9PEZI
MTSLLYYFRHQRVLPSVESNDLPMDETPSKGAPDSPASMESSSPSVASQTSVIISGMSETPSPTQRPLAGDSDADDNDRPFTLKRKASGPLNSGRTPAFVSKRWKTLNRPMDPGGPCARVREIRQPVSAADRVNKKTSWASRFNPLRLVGIKQGGESEVENDAIVVARSEYDLIMAQRNREIPDSQGTEDTEMATVAGDENDREVEGERGVEVEARAGVKSEVGFEVEDENEGDDEAEDDDIEDEEEVEDEENEEDEETEEQEMEENAYDDDDSGWYDPSLSGEVYPHPGLPQRVQSFKGSSLDTSIEQHVMDSDEYEDTEETLESEDDGVEENWDWLFEEEPEVDNDAAVVVPDANDYYWSVDTDERIAYEQGVAAIEGYQGWTADEKCLHRLLSLRGFHPLLPATWTRDFLGVPMYPFLFSPIHTDDMSEDTHPPVTITNYGNQFHATKALRALFDLQSRVSGLRQTGHNTARIGAIIERELRRYIAWAATDAGLDRCGPLAAMPNIAAKQFLVGGKAPKSPNRKGKKTKKRSLARQVQDFFGDWVARYRMYYAALPEYPLEEGDGKQRFRPPRLLYGFVIVQHAVMLLVVDAGGNRSSRHPRPRCLADFNLSLGDRWLDASLSVAIPVHVARAAQLRCRQGLVLPTTSVDDADEDA